MKKINLEEILESQKKLSPFIPLADYDILLAMKEACRQVLERNGKNRYDVDITSDMFKEDSSNDTTFVTYEEALEEGLLIAVELCQKK